MNVKQILNFLDPKYQNLPKINLNKSWKQYEKINIPVFEGEEKEIKKLFPCLGKVDFSGKSGELKEVLCNKQVFWLHGMGEKEKMTNRKIRRLFGKLYLGALAGKPKNIVIYSDPEWLELAGLAIHVAALDTKMFKGKQDKKNAPPEVVLVHKALSDAHLRLIKKGTNAAEAKNLMRILGTIPPNRLSTTVYAEVIKKLAKQWKLKCKQCSKRELQKYELLNAVSLGSVHDSHLLVITIPVKSKVKKETAVIGKGLCFDSGGLIGKQNYMNDMKLDMSGSAAVLGCLLDIVKNKKKLTRTTHFLLPLAENMMGSKAMRTDDVYTTGDGQTVEIKHTDAEGRLVLADAICYAKNNYKNVDEFYTIATLTGSCVVALGDLYTGVICNDEDLSKKITENGKITGDLMHVAPWDLEFDDNNSNFANMANVGEKDRDAGWIKAGLFMYRFVPKKDKKKKITKDAKFCHIDIAGSIDMHEGGKAWRKKGFSSGVAVTFLSEMITK